MDYWHIQLDKPWGPDEEGIDPIKMLENDPPLIGVGEWDNRQCDAFKECGNGQIVYVRKGNKPLALCQIIDDNFTSKEFTEKFRHVNFRKVKILEFWKKDGNCDLRQGTFNILYEKSRSDAWTFIDRWYKEVIGEQKMNQILAILVNNKNIILTGAPGTGKTYLARKIAESLTDKNNNQYAFVQFHPSYDYTDFVEGLRPYSKDNDKSEIGFELKNGIFKDFCKKAKEDPDKKYVFVIDEINRAEISKVFGELFFSIDPGYRGIKGKVKTQYSNMQTETTYFVSKDDDYFYVPENVYIIGTMNDIDRSVESFDFALRRRFAWVEINAGERCSMWDGIIDDWKNDAKLRMNRLNTAIENIDSLDTSYHIGPAYFLKLTNYKGDFDMLWDYHIELLIKEYLRGLHDSKEKVASLKSAYNGTEETNENN